MMTTVRPFSWRNAEAELLAAFNELPHAPSPKGQALNSIPYETLISGIPRQLLIMRPTSDGPGKEKRTSKAKTQRELAAVKDHADQLIATIEALHAPALGALGFQAGALRSLKSTLRVLSVAASQADVSGMPETTGRGRPAKTQARRIADVVARHYFGITGKPPTRTVSGDGPAYGWFTHLLQRVYEILRVNADPDGQARHAIKAMKKKGGLPF